MQIIAILVGIVKAVPLIDKWAERFFVAYRAWDKAKSIKENVEALRAVLEEFDQRKFEKAMGNPNPGTPSGDPGAVIRPVPPNELRN